MKREWAEHCIEAACTSPLLWAPFRKVLKPVPPVTLDLGDDLGLADLGFTRHKLRYLSKAYDEPVSRAEALRHWLETDRRSVCFTTYNHFIKSGATMLHGPSRYDFGPCLQSVVITRDIHPDGRLPPRGQVGKIWVDVFYRSTEIAKKFPSDLVFIRDVLLKPFDLPAGTPVICHFANMAVHYIYFPTVIPSLDDWHWSFQKIRRHDERFHTLILRGLSVIIGKRQKPKLLSQIKAVQRHLVESLPKSELRSLERYVEKGL